MWYPPSRIAFIGTLLISTIILLMTYHQRQLISELINDKVLYKNTYPSWDNSKSSGDFMYIDYIKRDCGELCDTDRPGVPGPYFDHVTANIDCKALFRNFFIDKGHGQQHAPKEIPKELLSYYNMNGKIKISSWYLDESHFERKVFTWKGESIDEMIFQAQQGKLRGPYGNGETNALRDGLARAPNIKNGRILVIGSMTPWVEACVLEAGAREVVTLEYGEIISKHPNVKTILPYDFRQSYLNGTLRKFDGIVTFSSVEHSGLGRYGDALNPWGDIITIARGWCVTKENGSLTIGVPYTTDDKIEFNAHRMYGRIRYPYLTTNWHQYYQGRGNQRVFVFTK